MSTIRAHESRPARVGCKDYARTALDMDTTGAIDYARSIHAVTPRGFELKVFLTVLAYAISG